VGVGPCTLCEFGLSLGGYALRTGWIFGAHAQVYRAVSAFGRALVEMQSALCPARQVCATMRDELSNPTLHTRLMHALRQVTFDGLCKYPFLRVRIDIFGAPLHFGDESISFIEYTVMIYQRVNVSDAHSFEWQQIGAVQCEHETVSNSVVQTIHPPLASTRSKLPVCSEHGQWRPLRTKRLLYPRAAPRVRLANGSNFWA
jgi:hypothetical protein